MEVAQFCSTSHVVIVAGKGGVGKTTVTAALAVAAARAGSSVLVVEVEGKSGLPTMFGAAPLSYDELDPYYAEPYYFLATNRQVLGDTAAAVVHYREFLRRAARMGLRAGHRSRHRQKPVSHG